MDSVQQQRAFASFAILGSLVLHFLLIRLILQQVIEIPPARHFISVTVVRPAPPPLPKLLPKPLPKLVVPPKPQPVIVPHVVKPVVPIAPRVVIHLRPLTHNLPRSTARHLAVSRPRPNLPPPMHFNPAGTEAGLGLDLGVPSTGSANGNGGLTAFDDAVKLRIQHAKTYPPGLPYMWNACVVEYAVTVDAGGQLVNYKLWGCDDPFLDSAARAAVLMASPFPVPPNFGGSQYTVFGSLVFKHP